MCSWRVLCDYACGQEASHFPCSPWASSGPSLSLRTASSTLRSVFSFSSSSDASASSCSLWTVSLSCRVFSLYSVSSRPLCSCSSAFWVCSVCVYSVSQRFSLHRTESCWERRSRARCRENTCCCSAWSSASSSARGSAPVPDSSSQGAWPVCCRTKRSRLGTVMGVFSGNFTLICFLGETVMFQNGKETGLTDIKESAWWVCHLCLGKNSTDGRWSTINSQGRSLRPTFTLKRQHIYSQSLLNALTCEA